MSDGIPEIVSADETLLPGGPAVLYAPRPTMADDSGTAWYAGALALVFLLGFFLAIVAVGAANKFAGRAPTIIQPALLDPPAVIVLPLESPNAVPLATGACIPSMEPCK